MGIFEKLLGLLLLTICSYIVIFAIISHKLFFINSIITGIFIIVLFIPTVLFITILMNLSLADRNVKDSKSGIGRSGDMKITKETEKKGDAIVKAMKNDVASIQKDNMVDVQNVQTAFLKIEERLSNEIKAIGQRGNNNLIIGSIVAFLGCLLLLWFIYEVNNKELEGWNLLNAILPRLSIVMIIEVFSFFFLKLYKESIDRIRYYHNELTNIQSKKTALLIACMVENDNEHKKSLIENLISVERNIFLKKGETTIELEKIRMDNSFGNNVLKYIKDLGLGLTPMSK